MHRKVGRLSCTSGREADGAVLQGLPSPKLETPLSMRTPSGAKLFSLSQFATPPTALPDRRTFRSMADAQAHLEVSFPLKACPL